MKGVESRPTLPNTIEMDMTLPEADIGGLHFNSQQVHAVFEKKEDGWYYSRDILFFTARNINSDNSRDVLSEYLNSNVFQQEIWVNLPVMRFIEVSLPKESKGIKKYNGVAWWYWLLPYYKETHFACVTAGGNAYDTSASAVGGCAPAFRIL
jgi:hypothetical protein